MIIGASLNPCKIDIQAVLLIIDVAGEIPVQGSRGFGFQSTSTGGVVEVREAVAVTVGNNEC